MDSTYFDSTYTGQLGYPIPFDIKLPNDPGYDDHRHGRNFVAIFKPDPTHEKLYLVFLDKNERRCKMIAVHLTNANPGWWLDEEEQDVTFERLSYVAAGGMALALASVTNVSVDTVTALVAKSTTNALTADASLQALVSQKVLEKYPKTKQDMESYLFSHEWWDEALTNGNWLIISNNAITDTAASLMGHPSSYDQFGNTRNYPFRGAPLNISLQKMELLTDGIFRAANMTMGSEGSVASLSSVLGMEAYSRTVQELIKQAELTYREQKPFEIVALLKKMFNKTIHTTNSGKLFGITIEDAPARLDKFIEDNSNEVETICRVFGAFIGDPSLTCKDLIEGIASTESLYICTDPKLAQKYDERTAGMYKNILTNTMQLQAQLEQVKAVISVFHDDQKDNYFSIKSFFKKLFLKAIRSRSKVMAFIEDGDFVGLLCHVYGYNPTDDIRKRVDLRTLQKARLTLLMLFRPYTTKTTINGVEMEGGILGNTCDEVREFTMATRKEWATEYSKYRYGLEIGFTAMELSKGVTKTRAGLEIGKCIYYGLSVSVGEYIAWKYRQTKCFLSAFYEYKKLKIVCSKEPWYKRPLQLFTTSRFVDHASIAQF